MHRPIAVPVLSQESAKALEAGLFKDNEGAEWAAMQNAGRQLAQAIERDFQEVGNWPESPRLLVLVGKGHNGGDALIAAANLLRRFPAAKADLYFAFPETKWRPLVLRACRDLEGVVGERVQRLRGIEALAPVYDAAIDGVFGFQYKPPLSHAFGDVFETVNERCDVRLRAAVDLPSGLDDSRAFRADFTYATGSVKSPLLDPSLRRNAGRIRFLDLGFFRPEAKLERGAKAVLTTRTLQPLRRFRDPQSDKRTFGHLIVAGGSRSYPGAVMMTVRAALQSGVGLLTALVPESLVAAYAAQVPEAMWVGCPEAPDGGLALEALHLFRERLSRVSAMVIGPGLSRNPETLALVEALVGMSEVPVVLDADAIQKQIIKTGSAPRIITPHAGEYARVSDGLELKEFAQTTGVLTVLKGAPTCICDGDNEYYSLSGGPVLARGGSGDILAGMIAGLLAQKSREPLWAACAAVHWHGLAADMLARTRGANAVRTTELLDFLPSVLREEDLA